MTSIPKLTVPPVVIVCVSGVFAIEMCGAGTNVSWYVLCASGLFGAPVPLARVRLTPPTGSVVVA